MEQQKNSFKDYRTTKRYEISRMSSLIESMNSDFNKKERDLLISSYIVLVYAYWESSFHKFQNLILFSHKNIPLKSLPFNLRNKLLLALVKLSSGVNGKKIINEVDNIQVFEKITHTTQENENLSMEEINVKYDNIQSLDKFFLIESANPNLKLCEEMLQVYDMNLKIIIKDGKNNEKLKTYFDDGLDFIIKQRNSIAHKNEKISYLGVEYGEYDSCIQSLIDRIAEGTNTLKRPEDFINEMAFQIDSFFDVMVDSLEKNIEELKKKHV